MCPREIESVRLSWCFDSTSPQNKVHFLDILPRECLTLHSTMHVTFSDVDVMVTYFPEEKRNFATKWDAHKIISLGISRYEAKVSSSRNPESSSIRGKAGSVELKDLICDFLFFVFEQVQPGSGSRKEQCLVTRFKLVPECTAFCLDGFDQTKKESVAMLVAITSF